MSNKPDIDPQETQEWLDALEAVLENEGVERAHFLLESLIDKARRSGAYLPFSANTAYLNTIPITQQEKFPGDRAMERRTAAARPTFVALTLARRSAGGSPRSILSRIS